MERNPDSPSNPNSPLSLSPTDFERWVLMWMREWAKRQNLSIDAKHQGVIAGDGGDYVIDILLELALFDGARILILVECKHQKRPVERAELLVLEGKLRDVGGHKGMLFSTSGFQSGAISYATARAIATVTVVDGSTLYETRSLGGSSRPPPWVQLDRVMGIRVTKSDVGTACHTIERGRVDALVEWFSPSNESKGE